VDKISELLALRLRTTKLQIEDEMNPQVLAFAPVSLPRVNCRTKAAGTTNRLGIAGPLNIPSGAGTQLRCTPTPRANDWDG
jgi:hypothetical protein